MDKVGWGDWPAWVQAVGSVIAIVFSVILWRLDRGRVNDSSKELARTFAVFTVDAMEAALVGIKAADMEFRKLQADRLRAVLELGRDVRLADLRGEAAVLVTTIRACNMSFLRELDAFNANSLIVQAHMLAILTPLKDTAETARKNLKTWL